MSGRWIAAALCGVLAARPATAQTLDRPDTASQRSSRLFVRRDLYVAGAFVATTAAMLPLDRSLARALQDSSLQASSLLKNGATGARLIGSPGALILTGGMFAAGRLLDAPRLADVGLHTFESVAMAEGITRVLKSVAGRERPYASPRDAANYRLGGGFGDADRRSMPSGHTSSAFAAAAAGTAEVGHWWPRRRTLARGHALFRGHAHRAVADVQRQALGERRGGGRGDRGVQRVEGGGLHPRAPEQPARPPAAGRTCGPCRRRRDGDRLVVARAVDGFRGR